MQFNKESQLQNEDKLSLVQEKNKTWHIREIKRLSYGGSGG